MKQSSIDWLIDQLQAPCRGIPSHIIEQAKAMHKEEIIRSYKNAMASAYFNTHNWMPQEGYEDAYIAGAYFCTENSNLIKKTSSEEREIRQTLKEIIRMKKRILELEGIIRQRQSK